MLDALEREIAALEADPSSSFTEESPFAEVNELARGFGFEVCSED